MSSEQDSPQEVMSEAFLLTDTALYAAFQDGDPDALGALYDSHAALVYGIALKALGDPQDAEDLTHDIFVNLLRRGSYDPARGSLRTYLAILTRSRAIDRIRSRKSRQHLHRRYQSTPEEAMALPTVLEQASQQEQSLEVRAAMSVLSDAQRQILHMAYYEGLTQVQISQCLGIPLGTVKARVRRGLIKLRQLLTQGSQDP